MAKMMEEKLRSVIETQLRERLLGPGYTKEIFCCDEDCSNEILDQDPLKVYTTGILSPRSSVNSLLFDVEGEEEVDEGNAESPVVLDDDDDNTNLSDISKASEAETDQNICDHIGIITCVSSETTQIHVDVTYAKYVQIAPEAYSNIKLKLGHNFRLLDQLLAQYDQHQDLIDELQRLHVQGPFSALFVRNDADNTISISKSIILDRSKLPYITDGDLNEVNYLIKRLFDNMYQRVAHSASFDVNVTERCDQDGCEIPGNEDLTYSTKVFVQNGKKYVKIIVRNKLSTESKAQYSNCLFQTEMKANILNGNLLIFSDPVNLCIDEENNVIDYVYRNIVNYGKGIGCAVEWSSDAKTIKTAYMPACDVKKFSNELNADYCNKLDINHETIESCCTLLNLSHWAEDANYLDRLRAFVDGYGVWYNQQLQKANAESPEFKVTAQSIVEGQRELLDRLNDNIDYLATHPEALTCFKYANTAMLIQMTIARNPHFRKNRNVADINENRAIFDSIGWFGNLDNTGACKYRPFQLAFLLMNVKSTFEQNDTYRNDVVDLIWFPTGGGKTEAYLALTALTIIARRRGRCEEREKNGVSVIMRYTLRLLTSQQFERASYLICALEFLRTECQAAGLGTNEISIGQWIGNSKRSEWDNRDGKWRKFNDLTNAEKLQAKNSHPIAYCPWCGAKLVSDKAHGYINYNDAQCINPNCHFQHLPIYYVDEAVREKKPTLLFGTVDKFAQIYTQEGAALLGRGTDAKSPDLIIQDELHLISGPLGSMVGFFESVMEQMCSKDGRKPKVVASTATTRNTSDLVRRLYGRDVRVFPAQGLTFEDNYFSHVEEDSLRRHLGICPQGYPVQSEIRIIAQLILARITLVKSYLNCLGIDPFDLAALKNAIALGNKLQQDIDNYWSLVLYYNSLKDLGRTRSRVSGEIFENMRYQKRYMQVPPTLDFIWQGVDQRIKEFTSREDSSRIKDLLTTAESVTTFKDVAPSNYLRIKYDAMDLVLASNMISVGIDIARWNIMLMSGQPRSTSEYIQSSSRVGRTHLGLVVNLYSPKRIREASMFENFTSYHNAYYRYVEPLSATPVTIQTIDNKLLNNIRECYKNHICNNLPKNDIIDRIAHDFSIRYEIDDEIIKYLKEVLEENWDHDLFASSLRDIDPNCYTKIDGLAY